MEQNLHDFELARAGDTAARNRIVEANYPLAVWIANRMSSLPLSLDDRISEACIALMKAVRHFDPSHQVQFSTFATVTIQRHLRRMSNYQACVISIPPMPVQSPPSVGTLDLKFPPNIAHPDDDGFAPDEIQRAMKLLDRLPDREQLILKKRFWGGFTLREVADQVGLSRQRVNQLERIALRQLRAWLEAREAA